MENNELRALEEKVRRYKPDSLDDLCKRTKFSKAELQIMYRGFKQACPTGYLDEATFLNIFAQFFPLGDANQYARYVFQTFDRDSNGCISFEEFLIGLSVLARGSATDKLRWAFTLYDMNRDGIITRREMHAIVTSIYDMMGKCATPDYNYASIKEHVDAVFARMDEDGDGVITEEEFMQSCLSNESIVHSVVMFDTSL